MDSIKERPAHCMFQGGTLSLSPEIKTGSCQATKASSSRGNGRCKGLGLSYVNILCGAGRGRGGGLVRPASRLVRKAELWQTVGYRRVLVRHCNCGSGAVLWQTHLSAQPFQQDMEKGEKGFGQEDPGHKASWVWILSPPRPVHTRQQGESTCKS